MTLTTPLGLLGLLSLPLILALHMLRARSARYTVSSLSLWDFLEAEKTGQKARTIPLTWLLALHLLIAALLSFALAQPRLDVALPTREARHLIILLDTSTSMGAADLLPTRFGQARLEAAGLLDTLGPNDILTFITFGRAAHTLGDTRTADLQALLPRLVALQPGGTGSDLQTALTLARAAHAPNLPAEIHIFTDAAYPQPNLTGYPHPLQWHLFGKDTPNEAVLTLRVVPISPTKTQIFARLANFGEQPVTRVVNLLADGQTVTSVQVTLEPGAALPYSWELVGRAEEIVVHLDSDDALPADNRAALGLQTPRPLQVALIAAHPAPLDRALQAAPGVELTTLHPDDYLPGSAYDLTVFRGWLPERWPGGEALVFEPPEDGTLLPTGTPAALTTLPVPQPDPLLQDVDLTGIRWGQAHTLQSIPPELAPILQAGNLPLILKGKIGLTQIVLVLPDLLSGNFARHPAFPILVGNLVAAAGRSPLPQQIAAGEPLSLPPAAQYPGVQIALPGASPIALPADRPNAWVNTAAPGPYRLTLTDLDGRTTEHTVGINAGDTAESDIAPQAWANTLPSHAAAAAQPLTQTSLLLTPWLLGTVAVLLLLEAWFAWR